MGINVLSLFDGISCGQIALERSNIKVDKYFASEIKTNAIKVTQHNYPGTVQLGDVRNIHYTNMGIEVDNLSKTQTRFIGCDIDLIIGGSPCKGNSGLNNSRNGLEHHESILFYEYARILKQIQIKNPKVKFLLENTQGSKDSTKLITDELGVIPLTINSRLVSAQNRPRYYWTNIPITSLPIDKKITVLDILETENLDKYIVPGNRLKWLNSKSGLNSISKGYARINPFPKASCITANGRKKWTENYLSYNDTLRTFSQLELERLQTLPEGYTIILNYGDAYDVIGDGWTVDIISHILNGIK